MAEWLVGWERRPGAQATVVIVPHALGGPSAYRPWLGLLPPSLDLRVASLPGRERRIAEPPATRLEPLADEVARAAAALATPIVLFGHSQGALIAFEAARRLEASGAPLVHLFASGCWAPQNNRRHPGLPAPDATDDEVLASLLAVGGVPAELTGDESMVQVLIRLWRADGQVTGGYRHFAAFPPLAAPLTAMGGADDHLFPPSGLDAWAEHTTARFDVQVFPGGHFYLLDHPAPVVAAIHSVFHEVPSEAQRGPGRAESETRHITP